MSNVLLESLQTLCVGDKAAPSERTAQIRRALGADELVFDKKRAKKIFETLYRSFIQSGFSIEQHAPQWAHRPVGIPVGSSDHRRWLLFAASTDLRSQSDVVYFEHRKLWEGEAFGLQFDDTKKNTRELYTENVLSWEDQDFVWALAKRRFGNPRLNIGWWRMRAETLWKELGGDPFEIYGMGSIDKIMEWKRSQKHDPLPGMGPKIASLLAIFFEEIGLTHVPDAFPVDVHVQRFCLAQNIVVPRARVAPVLNETLEAIIRPAIVEICDAFGWSRVILSHAIWFRGNRGCTNCWRFGTPALCPVYETCKGAYRTRPYTKMGLWLLEEPRLKRGGDTGIVPFGERPLFAGTGE